MPELDNAIAVTAAVIVRGGRLLICQRGHGSTHAGRWEFPGGKLEPGESLAECMRRELEEELGIDATVGEIVWRTRCEAPSRRPLDLTFFHIPAFRGEPENRIFAAIRWTEITELGEFDFLDGDREIVTALGRGEIRLV